MERRWQRAWPRMAASTLIIGVLAMLSLGGGPSSSQAVAQSNDGVPISEETERCLSCHRTATPGVVQDWRNSRHAHRTPAQAAQVEERARRMSTPLIEVPDEARQVAVGCYECHGRRTEQHEDAFDHNGFRINVVVSPDDCATCHRTERQEYAGTKKAHAYGILKKNPVYNQLMETTTRTQTVEGGELAPGDSSDSTQHETCLGCHGTDVQVQGMKTVESPFGPQQVPDLTGWPNQGVGRLNPDGSRGSCAACHPRHGFSIKVARKPYNCAQCHLDPDVPAWNVYKESKHGNIALSAGEDYDWTAVPWTVGEDFNAPTCATCHNSQLVSPRGSTVAERTHDFGARLWTRIFGLIYTHPQPESGKTFEIENADGLPLPTTFTGEEASDFLISPEEQAARKDVMKGVCRSCHSADWVNQHFAKLEQTLEETDQMTLAATQLLLEAWESGMAEGLPQDANPFDEGIEHLWIKQWLFFGNSIRYASAMSGAPDYATFKNGWWDLNTNLQKMEEWIELRR